MQKKVDFIDPFYDKVKQNLHKQMQPVLKQKRSNAHFGSQNQFEENEYMLTKTSDPPLERTISNDISEMFAISEALRKQFYQKAREEVKAKKKLIEEAEEYLVNGTVFLKYGKRGSAHPIHVFLFKKNVEDPGMLCWKKPDVNTFRTNK